MTGDFGPRIARAAPGRRIDSVRIELASMSDLQDLASLEKAAFSGDLITVRSWRHLLASASAIVIVARSTTSARTAAPLIGAAVVLRRQGTSVTRLYSLAVAPTARRRGVAGMLLVEAADRMRELGAAVLRLETRVDNLAAQRLFSAQGFQPLDARKAYYEDGADALRFEKPLWKLGTSAANSDLQAPYHVDEFHRTTRYGRRRHSAAVVLSKET